MLASIGSPAARIKRPSPWSVSAGPCHPPPALRSTPSSTTFDEPLLNPYEQHDDIPPTTARSSPPSSTPSALQQGDWIADGIYVSEAAATNASPYSWVRNRNVGNVSTRKSGDVHTTKGCVSCQGCPAQVTYIYNIYTAVYTSENLLVLINSHCLACKWARSYC